MKKLLIFICLLGFMQSVSAHGDETHVLNATITKNQILGNVFVYNLSNAKLHTATCEWAEKCTKNCIYIDRKQLEKIFYIPCLVCGGGVIEPATENEQ